MTKIKERINFKNVINNHQKVDSLKTIWDTFSKIMGNIKKNEISPETIKNQTSEWLKEFLSVYHKSNVTPYIHIFVTHLHEFVDLYGDINLYTCQGNEKLNDLMKTYWFRSNNKKENELVQLMQKRNRIEFNEFYQDINESKNN